MKEPATGAVDSHRHRTSAMFSACHPICLQKTWAKEHPEIRWSAVSDPWPQIAHMSSSSTLLFSRLLLQLILFFVSSQPKNFTRGVAMFFQMN